MLDIIHKYIKGHLRDWDIPPNISCPALWKPIFRSNLNYNYVKEYPLITRIIFWIEDGQLRLVTKILDKSLSRESVDDCIDYQTNLNKQLGYDLFPTLYDIADINGYLVLFEPGIQKSTYETELKRTIFTPEATHPYIDRVLKRQFSEMGSLFSKLLGFVSPGEKQWGQTFSDLGYRLNELLGEEFINPSQLDTMKQNIDSIPIHKTPVIADLACQNIFPGPQLIDNLIPDIKGRNESLPGILNAFRFMVPIFYCPPLRNTLANWVQSLAEAINDNSEETYLSRPVRGLCRAVGINPDNYEVVWAFIMGATFSKMLNALDFYKNNSFVNLKKEYIEWLKDLIAVQEILKDSGRSSNGKTNRYYSTDTQSNR